MSTPSSVLDRISNEKYVRAFQAIASDVTQTQRELLLAHYRAPAQTVTATELAKAMGWKNYGPVNLQYGKLARRLNEILNVPLGTWVLINVLVIFDESGPEIEWIMRPQVAGALRALGWC